MPHETNPAHLLEVRTNSHLSMDYDSGKFHPLVELVLIGYRAQYDLDVSPEGDGARVKKNLVSHTSRVIITRQSAEALKLTMEKVISHLDSLASLAEPLSEIVADKMHADTEAPTPVPTT